ncbi:tyrosine-type recombinase/integrase [Pseudomonas sp. LTR0]|uniref:tyrosine-type recombinase/integrase n=1 Tax=Pseudomonas sp. LTR0 TaxID=3040601 RepID=UPI0030CB8E81
MLCNFFYTTSIYLGKEHHTLRYSDSASHGKEFTPLTIHLREMINQGSHPETIRMAGYSLANFLDYFQEGLRHINPTKSEINILYREYHSFLTSGEASPSKTIRKICEVKRSPLVDISSSRTYHSFIKPFLKNLLDIQQTYNEYIDNGLIAEPPEASMLIDSLIKITPSTPRIQEKEKRKLVQHATPLTASTGYKTHRESLTSHIPYEENFQKPLEEHQFFPLEKITALVENASCYRNSCLYALIAATNARDSEADQILWRDINFESREILLIEPSTRHNRSDAYKGLSELQINKLQWKGRGTPLTVLLEPYATLFFKYLELYIRHEYNPSCGHNFIFHNRDGKPLYLCDYSSVVLHQFKQAAARTLPDQPHITHRLGLHSLRHSNIYFLKNYVEHSNGQGLTDSELLLLTGHKDIRSLQKYAKADRELLMEKISYANFSRKHGDTLSSTEFQIQYLEERLSTFKEKLKNLKS